MGNCLAPILADIYINMAHLEEQHFLKQVLPYSPTFYRRYVDDTFALFTDRNHVDPFLEFINLIEPSIQFDVEHENNDTLSFLDTNMTRASNHLYPDVSTRIKPTDKGLFYNFNSFVSVSFKNNLMSTLIFRVFSIASSYIIFNENLQTLKTKFFKNGFPSFSFDAATNKFLYKQYNPNCDIISTVNKKTDVIVLPYLRYLSIIMTRKIASLVSKYYPTADFKIIFKSGCSMRKMFCYKDKVPKKCLVKLCTIHIVKSVGLVVVKLILEKPKIHYERFHSSNGHLHPISNCNVSVTVTDWM